MAYFRNADWKEDHGLKSDLQKYVKEDLRRTEILDFVKRDFSQYAWSLSSLDRRMRHFEIYYTDNNVTVEQIRAAVEKEVDGPGKLLGYRAMQKTLRQTHELKVPRDVVYAVMQDVDPEGLEARGGVGHPKQKKKGKYTTKGPNFVHSLDGHDKLMGYQNSTFPLAIYGCIDTASRKILWLKIWVSNSDPNELDIGTWSIFLKLDFCLGILESIREQKQEQWQQCMPICISCLVQLTLLTPSYMAHPHLIRYHICKFPFQISHLCNNLLRGTSLELSLSQKHILSCD